MDSWLLMMLAFVAVVSPAIFQALSGSGSAELALSVSGRAAPALSGSGRPRRLLMADYSKPTDAPAPAPAHSPNNPICMSCCPEKTFAAFAIINKVFGWWLAVYLGFGIVYFIHLSCLSFKNLPDLPRLPVPLEEGDIERLQNLALASGAQEPPTVEELRALTRVRTQLDEHMQKHNTGSLVWATGGEVGECCQRFRAAYKYCTSWMIPVGTPFLTCYLALKFSWPVFETFGAPAWAGTWSI